MDGQTAAILGVWVFAAATAMSKQVAGWFMLVAFVVAVLTTAFILG
jgi:hypothetical protein